MSPPLPLSPSSSRQPASRFREHLSISLPPASDTSTFVEKSRFSPVSPSSPSRAPSSTATPKSFPRDLEGNRSPPASGMRDRFTRFFFDMRTFGREQDMLPIQEPHLANWPPLHVEKRQVECSCHTDKAQKKRRRWLMFGLGVFFLFLFSNIVFLNVRVLSTPPMYTSQSQSTTIASAASATATAISLSADAQQCVSQYELNAPTDPGTYPCSTCLPILQGIPSTFSYANASEGQQAQNAIQFCGLKGIFDSSNSDGQGNFANGGWFKDVKFCAWNGVTCSGDGRVSTLQLTFPGVPALLPNEIGSLDGLETLQVIGNNAIPAGTLPTSFTNLTSLTTLHLESTAITSLADNLFSSLQKVTTLELILNTQMSTGLPSSVSQISLHSLLVSGQPITTPLSSLFSSSTLQSSMLSIDLISASLSGPIPSSISSFSALTELRLDSNNLQPPLPSTFPPHLQSLSLANNTALSGSLPGTVCSSTGLTSCDMRGTALTGGCGQCQFS